MGRLLSLLISKLGKPNPRRIIVGKVENGCDLFATGGQTNGFSQFKVDSICLLMFLHCGAFSIGS